MGVSFGEEVYKDRAVFVSGSFGVLLGVVESLLVTVPVLGM